MKSWPRYLALFATIVIGIVLFVSYQAQVKRPPNEEMDLTNPQTRSIQLDFQNRIDQVAQAAADNDWARCNHYYGQLILAWDASKPQTAHPLGFVKEIDHGLNQLELSITLQDRALVLATSAELVRSFSQVTKEQLNCCSYFILSLRGFASAF